MIVKLYESYGLFWDKEASYRYSLPPGVPDGAMSTREIFVEIPDELNPFINNSGMLAIHPENAYPWELNDLIDGRDEHPYIEYFDEHMTPVKVPLRRIEKPTLKELRQANGLTQAELAEASGIPLRTLRAYEQESRPLSGASVEVAYKLANALDVTVELLLGY